MAEPYPVNLVVEGRPCLVVGGGAVARRKVEGLLACGALVTVIAPDVAPDLAALPVTVERRPYRGGDAAGFRLVVAATDDRAVNARRLPRTARRPGSGSTPLTTPASCSFTLPSGRPSGPDHGHRLDRGPQPGPGRLAAPPRIEAELGGEYEVLLRLLSEARATIKAAGRSTEAVDWPSALDSNMLDLIRAGHISKQGSASRRVCHRRRTQPPHRPPRAARAGDGPACPPGQGARRPPVAGRPRRGGDPLDVHADRGLRHRRPLPPGRAGRSATSCASSSFSVARGRRRPPHVLYDDAAIGHLFAVAVRPRLRRARRERDPRPGRGRLGGGPGRGRCRPRAVGAVPPRRRGRQAGPLRDRHRPGHHVGVAGRRRPGRRPPRRRSTGGASSCWAPATWARA